MLRRIGDILHVARDRRFVLKLLITPPLGITIYDYAMRRLGVLYDIIGPVNSPYGLVRPDPQLSNIEEFVGKPAYAREVDLRRGGRRGHGRQTR